MPCRTGSDDCEISPGRFVVYLTEEGTETINLNQRNSKVCQCLGFPFLSLEMSVGSGEVHGIGPWDRGQIS